MVLPANLVHKKHLKSNVKENSLVAYTLLGRMSRKQELVGAEVLDIEQLQRGAIVK